MPCALAQDDESEPLKCDMAIDVYWTPAPPHWIGTISGDIVGTIQFWEGPATFPGTTQHFTENFTIRIADGAVINGVDYGVYNLNTYKFRSNGWVTDVTPGEWAFLEGYSFHELGTTTEFIYEGAVHGTAVMILSPP